MLLVAGIQKRFRSAARQVYALEAARLSFMAQANAQSHVGECGVNAVANNPAIPKPQFVDSLRASLTWSQRPQAVDYIRPGAGDRLQNFARSLQQYLGGNDKEAGVWAS